MLAAQSSPASVNGIVFGVAVLATSMALVAALAWISRQLLGRPVGAVRALIAGLLGFAAAVILGRYLHAAEPGHLVAFFTVALSVPLIVAMVFIVGAEAVVPTGTLPQPLELIQGTRRAVARSRRYSQITRIAVRHGLVLSCAGGDEGTRMPSAGGPRSRCPCGGHWKMAGLPSSSSANCWPRVVICSRMSSLPSSLSFRTGPSQRRGPRLRQC
jgi:hypothetical protein